MKETREPGLAAAAPLAAFAASAATGSAGPSASPVPELAFRPLRREDVPALVALERRIFGTPWDAQAFEAFLDSGPPFSRLAVAREAVAGYALGWCAAGESELMNLAVAPEWRRRSVGERLLRWTMAHCARAGARSMSLEVRASNVAAQRLYARHGFLEVARRRAYYRRPREDALVLRTRLAGTPGAGRASDLTARPGDV